MLRLISAALAASIAVSFTCGTANAATFDWDPNHPDAIIMTGSINEGDGWRFAGALAQHSGIKYINLASDGGEASAGGHIAELVHLNKIDTVINAGYSCGSMCAVIFSAGINRWAEYGAELCVHSLYVLDTTAPAAWNADGSKAKSGEESDATKAGTIMVVRKMSEWGTPNDLVARMVIAEPVTKWDCMDPSKTYPLWSKSF